MERESLQGKMLEMKEQKAEAEKDLIAIQYQKEELSKDCKELASKYDAKTE